MSSTMALYPAEPPVDHLRPSLFELLAQEQLRDLLHPVVRYVLSYLAQHRPRYFLRVLNRHEEFFAALLLLIERHHLKKHNASLSEHFYQLRLAPVSAIATPRLGMVTRGTPRRGLSRRQRWGMLVFLVGLPYVRARLQDYYERLGGGPDREDLNEEVIAPRTVVQRTFKIVYPYANLALDGALLGYDIAYMFEKTQYYRPWHAWLGLRVVRDDGYPSAVLGGDPSGTSSTSLLSRLPPLLPPLLLLLKLSQWWYSPSSPRHIAIASTETDIAKTHAAILPPRPLPILPGVKLLPRGSSPTGGRTGCDQAGEGRVSRGEDTGAADDAPPPYSPESASPSASLSLPAYKVDAEAYGTCPLCGDKWKNPAILPTGWVVCWRCGWDALEGEGEGEDETEGDGEDEQAEAQEDAEAEGAADVPVVGEEALGGETTSNKSGSLGDKVEGKRKKGCCPITGAPIGRGQLRRVLV